MPMQTESLMHEPQLHQLLEMRGESTTKPSEHDRILQLIVTQKQCLMWQRHPFTASLLLVHAAAAPRELLDLACWLVRQRVPLPWLFATAANLICFCAIARQVVQQLLQWHL